MPDRRIHRADLFALVVLALLITVTAWGHFGLQNRLYDIDTLTFYIPWYTHLGERLSSGDVPGWFDMQFSSAPFAADPQSGWMYLPAMLVFIFTGGASGYALFLILHWLLAS